MGWVSNDLLAVCKQLSLPVINRSMKAKNVALPGWQTIVSTVLEEVKLGDIIIFHDPGGVWFYFYKDRTQTLQALPIILQKLQDQGYSFVTVEELLFGAGPS
jgi:peptidoglycan-N-acetylglucosamine deacetylase